LKLLGVNGTLTGSKTLVIMNRLLNEVRKADPGLEVELLDLKKYDIQFCDGRPLEQYNEDTQKVVNLASSADAYIIGTPIFQGSITGALKNWIDLIPPPVFRNKVMGFFATGGTHQHYLVIENQLKPIAGYFRAYVAPGYVYAQTDDFNEKNEIANLEIEERIANLAQEVTRMTKLLRA